MNAYAVEEPGMVGRLLMEMEAENAACVSVETKAGLAGTA